MSSRKRGTIARSFRIDEELMEILNEDAKKEGISSNTLLNKILIDYSEFFRYAKSFGIINISTSTLSRFVNCCSKEQIIETAEFSVNTLVKDGMRTIGLSANYDTVVFFIEKIFGGLANWFQCINHNKEGNREYFHLRHSLGDNWSIFIAEVISRMFMNYLNEKVETEFLPGSVTISRKK